MLNDALAVYVNTPACALAFVERWLVPGNDPPGFYELRTAVVIGPPIGGLRRSQRPSLKNAKSTD
jgi:hypothetical protein